MTVWQLVVDGPRPPHLTIRAFVVYREHCNWPYQRVLAAGDIVTFTGDVIAIDKGEVVVSVDDIAYVDETLPRTVSP
jgi:hypothetical protein